MRFRLGIYRNSRNFRSYVRFRACTATLMPPKRNATSPAPSCRQRKSEMTGPTGSEPDATSKAASRSTTSPAKTRPQPTPLAVPVSPAPKAMERDNDLDTTDLKLAAAFCCFNAYLYSGKGCCGWSDKSVCLCCENKSSTKMVECTMCCKSKSHLCCLVSNGAFPSDAEVPCQLALFGFACYPKCGCYLTQAELSGTYVQPTYVQPPIVINVTTTHVTVLAPAATPITSASTSAPTAPVAMEREDGLDTTNLKLATAFCCYNAYVYCGKGCCGASSKSVCLCCENKTSLKMVECTTCCKSKGQAFCLVSNGAFPSDAEVPCQLALFGLTCYPHLGCCLTQAELSGTYAIAATTPASQKEPLLDAKKDDAEADDDAEAE